MNLFDLSAKIRLDTTAFHAGLSKAQGAMKKFAGVSSGLLSGVTKVAKAGITAIGAASVAVAGYAVKSGMAFEAEMSKVQALSQASGEDLARLTAKAKQLGIDTKYSATEAGTAMEYMAMAGWKVEDMLKGVDGVISLAAASGEDLALVSDIVTDALTAFGLEANQAGRFADVLAAAATNSNTTVAKMGETFKYVAPVAGALGYEIEDVATAIGLMASSGIKSSQAGTSLRMMLVRLAKPTKEVKSGLQMIGYSAEEAANILVDSEGKTRPFLDVLLEFRERFKGLSDAQKTQAATSIAGARAMTGLLSIVNASDKDFNDLSKALTNSTGAAKKMADIMQDNLRGELVLTKSSAEGLGIAMYGSIEPGIRKAVHAVRMGINKLAKAWEAGAKLQEGGFSRFIKTLPELMSGALEKISKMLPQAVSKFGEIILSVVRGITEKAPQIVSALFQAVEAAVQHLNLFLPELLSAGWRLVMALITGMLDAAPEIVFWIQNIFSQFNRTFEESLPSLITMGAQLVSTLLQGLIDSLPMLIDAAFLFINTFLQTIDENLESVVDGAFRVVEALATGLAKNLPKIVKSAVSIIEKLAVSLTSPENLSLLFNSALEILMALVDSLTTDNNLETLLDAAVKILDQLADFLSDKKNMDALAEASGKILGKLLAEMINILPTLTEDAIQIVAALGKLLGRQLAALKDIGKTLAKAVLQGFFEALNFDKIKNAIGSVSHLFMGGPEKVYGRPGTHEADLAQKRLLAGVDGEKAGKEIGKKIGDGIMTGTADGIRENQEKVTKALDEVEENVKKHEEISSPAARPQREVGVPIGEGVTSGIAEGLEKTRPAVLEAFSKMEVEVSEKAEKFADAIRQSLSRVQNYFRETREIASLEYELWELTEGAGATDAEKVAKKVEMLNEQLAAQEQLVLASQEAYEKMAETYGEESQQAMEYKRILLEEQIERERLTKDIQEQTGAYGELAEANYGWGTIIVDVAQGVGRAVSGAIRDVSNAVEDFEGIEGMEASETNSLLSHIIGLITSGDARVGVTNSRDFRSTSYA